MTNKDPKRPEISNGELFADLQTTMTEIMFCNMMSVELRKKYLERLSGNEAILESIKNIMRLRFTDDDYKRFLDIGFPRKIDLGRIT